MQPNKSSPLLHAKLFFFFKWVKRLLAIRFLIRNTTSTLHLNTYTRKNDVFKKMKNAKLILVVLGENNKNISTDDF